MAGEEALACLSHFVDVVLDGNGCWSTFLQHNYEILKLASFRKNNEKVLVYSKRAILTRILDLKNGVDSNAHRVTSVLRHEDVVTASFAYIICQLNVADR